MSSRVSVTDGQPRAARFPIPLLVFLCSTPWTAAGFNAPPTTATSQTASLKQTVTRESCSDIEKKVEAADEPAMLCRASLEAARCMVMNSCSDSLGRELCGTDRRGDQLREDASKVLSYLDRADQALERMQPAAQTADEARECIEMLRSFATVFRALGASPTTRPDRDELLSACGGLAGYFDDARIGISESAKLWQGVAYRRAGRPDRALQVLRPAISVPASRRIGLWARLERCRALADQGDYAAALALNLRLTARVDAWFEEEDRAVRQQAVDSVRWLRIELLKGWAERLKKGGQSDRAKEIDADADRLLGSDAWPIDQNRWLGLGPPVPDLPDCLSAATSHPTTAP